MQALLLVNDADEMAVLTLVLQRAGLSVRSAMDLERVAQSWPEQPTELLLVAAKKSVSLVQISSALSMIRAQSDIPVVVISEELDEDSQIQLLEAGADLVVFRPYSARLLITQIRALMRRSGGVPFFSLPTLKAGNVKLDPGARTVQLGDSHLIRLTQLEFRLLYSLMTHPGQVFPTEALVEYVWGYSGQGDRDLVRGLIRRLRAKIEPQPNSPVYILTVPGVGYVFQE